MVALASSPGTPVEEPACDIDPVTGTANEAVEATATGLSASTEYVYRVIATNTGGTTTGAPDQAAETATPAQPAPAVENNAPGAITESSIVMKGHVDNEGDGSGSSCKFVVALASSPGTPVEEPACDIDPVTGTANEAVEATATGLSASTEYVYRVIATNTGGTTTGAPDQAAETATPAQPAPAVENNAPGAITESSIVMKGHVDNEGDGSGSSCKFVVALASSPGTPVEEPACDIDPVTGTANEAVEATATGLSASTEYVYRVIATNTGGTTTGAPDQAAETATPAQPAPAVENNAPGAITESSIVMKGHVDNEGDGCGSSCKFVVALASSPGTPVEEPACDIDPVTGTANEAVEATATGLSASTEYVYRVIATNTGGTTTGAPDQAAETAAPAQPAPAVENNAPGAITESSIVMKGHVDNEGDGSGSSCKFVVALASSPGTPVEEPACDIDPVTGTANEAVEATATGLSASTEYVYRVIATNTGGTTTGAPDQAAETSAAPEPPPSPRSAPTKARPAAVSS